MTDSTLLLPIDLTQAPDSVPPISTGVYTLEVTKVEVKPHKKDPSKRNVVLELKVVAPEGDELNRIISLYCSIDDPRGAKSQGQVMLRRVILSGGKQPDTSLNVLSLQGLRIRALISNGIYTNPETNQSRMTANVDNVLIPGDPGYAV